MFCEECGAKLDDDALFCMSCGHKVTPLTAPEPVVEPVVVAEPVVEPVAVAEPVVEPVAVAEPAVEPVAVAEPVVEPVAVAEPVVEDEVAKQIVAPMMEEQAETPKKMGTGNFCQSCGAANKPGDKFCMSCGKPMSNAGAVVPVKKKAVKQKPARKKEGGSKKLFILIGAGVALLAVVIGLAFFIFKGFGGGGVQKDLLYVKDGELFRDGQREMALDRSYYGNLDLLRDGSAVFSTKYSQDGKYLFYPDNVYDDGYDLYVLSKNGKAGDEILLANGVRAYELLSDNRVIYWTRDSRLYIANSFAEKDLIAEQALGYRLSEDQKYLLWTTAVDGENRLYVQDTSFKGERTKLDSNIQTLEATKNFEHIYYTKENSLYDLIAFQEKQKVAEDVYDWWIVGDRSTEGLYYTKADSNISLFNKLVEDDAEWNWTEEDFYSYSGFFDNIGTLYGYTSKNGSVAIFGDHPVVITQMQRYMDASYVIARLLDVDALRRAKTSSESFYQEMYENFVSAEKCYYKGTLEATPVLLSDKMGSDYDFNTLTAWADEEATKVVMTVSKKGSYEQEGLSSKKDLYEVVGDEFKLLDTDVYSMESVEKEGVYYTKDITEGEWETYGDLYFNGQRVDSDVHVGSCKILPSGKGVTYWTDYHWNDDRYYETVTLKIAYGKDAKSIASDVSKAVYATESERDRIAFLMDYSGNSGTGDLAIYDEGDLRKIDTDVSGVLYIN